MLEALPARPEKVPVPRKAWCSALPNNFLALSASLDGCVRVVQRALVHVDVVSVGQEIEVAAVGLRS